MMRRTARLALVALLVGPAAGCVERRFVVETNVPGAQVSINNVPIGPSPADSAFEYTGKYAVRATAPGYEPLYQVVDVRPKWYERPPIDFFFDALYPFHIEDVRRVRLTLVEQAPVRTDELLTAAESARAKGQSLPPPQEPDVPRQRVPQPYGVPPGTVPADPVPPGAVMPGPGSGAGRPQ